jgi:hypothetical protein
MITPESAPFSFRSHVAVCDQIQRGLDWLQSLLGFGQDELTLEMNQKAMIARTQHVPIKALATTYRGCPTHGYNISVDGSCAICQFLNPPSDICDPVITLILSFFGGSCLLRSEELKLGMTHLFLFGCRFLLHASTL